MSDTHTSIPQLNLLNLPQLQAIKQQIDSLIKQGGAEPLHLQANVNLAHLADVAQQVQLKPPGQSEPGDAARECFPAASRFEVGPDGALTEEPKEPIAADARREGGGKHLALQKIIAGLFGATADNRRVKITAAGVLVFAVLALLAGYLFVEHRRQLALEQARLPAEEAQSQEQQRTNAGTKALVEKLLATSQVEAAPGAERAVGAAVDTAAQGAAAGDARWQRALALLHAGNVKEAEPLFRAVADQKVAQISQDKKDAVAAYRNLGAIAGLADPKRAREAYAQAVALDPDGREAPSVLSNRIGNVQVAQDDLAGALKSYRETFAIADRLVKSGPDNAGWQGDLSVSSNRIGKVQVAQGDLAGALKSYRETLAITDRLAKSDPGNAGWQRDLSASYANVGDVQVAQGDLAGALKSYRDSHAIRERLAKSDPGNAGWQSDLSASYANVGNVQVAQGDLAGALKPFREALAIADRVTKSDPGNARWQHDLSASYSNLAEVFKKQGEKAKALDALRQGRAIVVRMTSLSPDNAVWKRDLAWFDGQIAELANRKRQATGR